MNREDVTDEELAFLRDRRRAEAHRSSYNMGLYQAISILKAKRDIYRQNRRAEDQQTLAADPVREAQSAQIDKTLNEFVDNALNAMGTCAIGEVK